MRLTIVYSLFIVFLATYSGGVTAKEVYFRKLLDKFFLISSSCEQALKQSKSFEEWTLKTKNGSCKERNSSEGISEREGMCFVDISDCLPEHVKKYHGTSSEKDGPNCWNLSLVMTGLLPHLTFTPDYAMGMFMSPPFCRLLDKGEERQPGDIGAIRSEESFNMNKNSEVHGFVYINEDFVYSKNGFASMFPYGIYAAKDVYAGYGMVGGDRECWGNQIDRSQCDIGVDFYRCLSVDEILENFYNIEEEDPVMLSLSEKMDQIECLFSREFFNPDYYSSVETLSTIRDVLEVIEFDLKQMGDYKRSFVEDTLMTKSVIQLLGVKGQVNRIYNNGSPYEEEDVYAIFDSIDRSLEKVNQLGQQD